MAPPVGPQLLAVAESRGHDGATLERGRRIYVTKCAACHSIEPIGRYSAEQWRALLPDMVAQTKLDAKETADVEAYLLTARAAWPVQ